MGEIRFVGTGETRGYPYLVCKKLLSAVMEKNQGTQRRVRNNVVNEPSVLEPLKLYCICFSM